MPLKKADQDFTPHISVRVKGVSCVLIIFPVFTLQPYSGILFLQDPDDRTPTKL